MSSTAGSEQVAVFICGNRGHWDALHGHPLDVTTMRISVAEAAGTFFLVLTIISTAIAATPAKPAAGPAYGSLAVPLAGGLMLAAAAASLGPVSGAHLNPAVTVTLALNRRLPWRRVPAYVLAQFAGAIGAALVAWALYGDRARTVAYLGATYPASGVGAWRALGAETVVTFLLVMVIIVATDPRIPGGVAAMAIGFALVAAILIAGPLTGAGVNPARAIGPMIIAGKFTDWWSYLAGPLLGGAAAVWLHGRLVRPGQLPAGTGQSTAVGNFRPRTRSTRSLGPGSSAIRCPNRLNESTSPTAPSNPTSAASTQTRRTLASATPQNHHQPPTRLAVPDSGTGRRRHRRRLAEPA